MMVELATHWPEHLGHMLAPSNRNSVASLVKTGLPWSLDNGAFSGFDPVSFRRRLRLVQGQPGLLWIVCPDRVGDASATLQLFEAWREEVAQAGPVAFAGQDGAEDTDIPWERFDCWFVGGSTRWKLSRASADLATEAKRRHKWLHVGRVNSLRRLRACYDLGADSVDGSGYSRFAAVARLKGRSDMLLERHLAYLGELEEQRRLFA